jgi:uncharacterized protein YjbI with pentapeptide repeats
LAEQNVTGVEISSRRRHVEFQVPSYLLDLTRALNDAAKSAQSSIFAFAGVAFYLLATGLLTSDLDILLDRSMHVSQLGVEVPIVFSFAIAPFILLLLHLYTLARFDSLADTLVVFRRELTLRVPEAGHRELCVQLVVNAELIQQQLLTPRSRNSWLFAWSSWALTIGLPVCVLTILQISALRYQSDSVTLAQRICFLADISFVIWFCYRQNARKRGALSTLSNAGKVKRAVRLIWLPVVLLATNFIYFNVPSPDADTVRFEEHEADYPTGVSFIFKQPVDILICPLVRWGCRYLRVDHQTILGQVWDPQAVISMASTVLGSKPAFGAIEGVYLRDRTLRFADFSQSKMYFANLISADLRGSKFDDAQLPEAQLANAKFDRASMQGANLQGANLREAAMSEANLSDANFQTAYLEGANLRGAELLRAQMQGVDLSNANLRHVDASLADFSGSNLMKTDFDGAIVKGTNWSFANLSDAKFKENVPDMKRYFNGAEPMDGAPFVVSVVGTDAKYVGLSQYYASLASYLVNVLAPESPRFALGVAQRVILNSSFVSENIELDSSADEPMQRDSAAHIACALVEAVENQKLAIPSDRLIKLRAIAQPPCEPSKFSSY